MENDTHEEIVEAIIDDLQMTPEDREQYLQIERNIHLLSCYDVSEMSTEELRSMRGFQSALESDAHKIKSKYLPRCSSSK